MLAAEREGSSGGLEGVSLGELVVLALDSQKLTLYQLTVSDVR